MPVAWFIAPYRQVTPRTRAARAARVNVVTQYAVQIKQAGGRYAVTEIPGGYGVAKVDAPNSVLQAIANEAGVTRIPVSHLGDSLATLTTQQRAALRSLVTDTIGISEAEIQERLPGDIGSYTLGDVLRFLARRRRRLRVDPGGVIVYDGDDIPTEPVGVVDARVP